MTLVGDLATDTGTPSDGNATWTCTLKEGITYEDGTEIVAADIKYAVSRTYDPIFTAGPTYIQQWLSGKNYRETYGGPWTDGDLPDGLIDTPDDKTIVFHLREPVAEFAFAAALPMTSPVPVAQDTKESYDRKPFSSGPYRVAGHDDKSMTLVRNEHWDPETDPVRTAYPDAFDFEFGEEALAINNRLISSVGADTTAMTFSAGVPADLLQQFDTSADLADRRVSAPAKGMQYFAINTQRITDETVREAVVTAWPKQQLRQVMGGPLAGNIATTIMNPSVYGWEEFNAYPEIPETGDTEAAKVLLEEADAVGTSIVYGFRNDDTGQKLSVVVKNALEAAGFTVVLTPVDSSTYWDQLYPLENGMDLYFTSWSADWPAGSGVIPALFHSSNHFGEDQQSAGWPQLRWCRPREGQVAAAEEKTEDRKVDCGCDEGSDPGGHAEPEGEVEDVAEAEEGGEADDDAHDHGDGLNDGGLVRT